MERNLKEALKHRRSYYAIDNQTTIPDAEIEEILDFAALHTPSAFNSQSTRMVLPMEKHPLDLILQLTDSGFFHNRYRNDRASCFFL